MNSLVRPLKKLYRCLLDLREEQRLIRLGQPTPVLVDRCELPLLLNILNLRGEGVEIGVQRATFSSMILETWGGARLHSVDPWRSFDDPSYVDKANAPDSVQETIFQTAKQRLAKFGDRSVMVRATSAEAAPGFAEDSLDFVYIDAQHHYEAVREDLELWHPKVRPGGILAGHDYLDGMVGGDLFGVKKAVDEFAATHGLKVWVTLEKEYATWICRLPE
ncbi:MAG: class I SAM-dependent methyltransferase [Verrucomicrobiae bacterium]|nr:class I SAM-dependent methyltransferase [Verrucomicrobiae bacterium]MCB1086502.1 class I SAM-dependent methyltransferase [Verrucomicrobiae bacterium]